MANNYEEIFFDKDYFENGIASGKSCYLNYRWLPELTIPMAFFMMQDIGIRPGDKLLDFGCSKGYLVKAFRLLGVNAYGVDISSYAIDHCDSEVREYCKKITVENPVPYNESFDWVISKDVLEHLSESYLDEFFKNYTSIAKNMFHIIPLGDNFKFRIQEYHDDVSHIQIHDELWWINLFKKYNWKNSRVKYSIKGVKENWALVHSKGNGFFILNK